ncbi:MAG: protein translocase subunit SecD [Gemmatimonadales bacterium]|nr:protein translocase subunit SecD [Gemmatimonadales bacterium]
MFTNLRNRFIVIAILILASGFFLWNNKRKTTTPTHQGTIVNLGLDLQGGMHLGLELDQSNRVSSDPAGDIQLALTVLRKRIDEFGVLEPIIQTVGAERIVVELPGVTDPDRAKAVVQRSAFLEFKITDKTQALERSIGIMDRTLRDLGVTASVGATPARPSAVQDLLGADSAKEAESDSVITNGIFASLIQPSSAVGLPQVPGEYVVREGAYRQVDSLLRRPEVRRLWPRGIDFKWSNAPISAGVEQFRLLYALDERPIITGTHLVNAIAQLDPLTNGAEVNFELDRQGGRRFGQETARHVGDYMAIILDNEVQGRPPVIQSRIERQGRIQLGGRSLQEAQDLALTLRAGALPTPLKIVEERQVGPSLGADAIRGGIIAGIIGVIFVILMMILYYAWSGVIAIGALIIYTLMTFAALAAFEATLTLPGLAGFVLAIAMAVDANVLIFERIREELADGKTVRLSVDEGFKNALPAIIDSNLTTVLTALFLFQFGTGPVQGFAVTLIIGVFASMITAIFVTRTFFLAWLKRRPDMTTLSVGTYRAFKNAAYKFIENRRYAYIVTAAILTLGAVAIVARGINYSVEFTGGTLMHVKASEAITVDALRGGLEAEGFSGAEIQTFGASNEFVVRVRVGDNTTDADDTQQAGAAIAQALTKIVGAGNFSVERTEAVGPKVGGELQQKAFMAIFFSFFAVLAYLAYRFDWRFGLAAVVATVHDIGVTIAFIALLKLEVSLVVVAALLTVLGLSLNDTIVIFDRIRENLRDRRQMNFIDLLNRSVNETLPRTVLTGVTTLGTLIALSIFGTDVIRPFSLVLFFGILLATFSSIFIAAPILLWIQTKWPPAAGVAASAVKRVAASAKAQPTG